MTPNPKTVDDTLQRIADASTHSRDLARQRIAEFRLDREKGQALPIATAHDIHGAPLLDVKQVETGARPQYAPRFVLAGRKSWWRRLLQRR